MKFNNTDLVNMLSNLDKEERTLLLNRLNIPAKIETDNIILIDLPNMQYTQCVYCNSHKIKLHGTTKKGIQRYYCRTCRRTFSTNNNSGMRYTRLNEDTWIQVIKDFIENKSLSEMSQDIQCTKSTAWQCKQTICDMLSKEYKYNQLFEHANTGFKGTRDFDMFIYDLGRMPKHHMTKQERKDWLITNNLYDKLLIEEPEYLKQLLKEDNTKQDKQDMCLITLIDIQGNTYLESFSLKEIEEAFSKISDTKNKKYEYKIVGIDNIQNEISPYLDNIPGRTYNTYDTIILFWWLQRYKNFSTKEKVRALYNLLK